MTVPPYWAALYASIVAVRPHASWLMERLRPAFCLTFFWLFGGAFADLTMFVMVSASGFCAELLDLVVRVLQAAGRLLTALAEALAVRCFAFQA